jgi:hypothetical protein
MIALALLWLGAAVLVGLTAGRVIRAGAGDQVAEEVGP